VGKYHTRTFRSAPGFKTIIKPGREALQRHRQRLRETIRQYRGASQAALIHALNPLIQGWANHYQHCVAKHTFQIPANVLYHQLTRWARYRHPRKSGKWCYHRYWRRVDGRVRESFGESVLSFHQTTNDLQITNDSILRLDICQEAVIRHRIRVHPYPAHGLSNVPQEVFICDLLLRQHH